MDLERLDEAIASDPLVANEWSRERVEMMRAAARAYRNALANGERVEWCEVHEARYHDGAPGCVFWMFAKVVKDRYGTEEPRPCIVSKLLIDPPTEEGS